MFKSRRKSTASNQEQPGYFDINKPSPTFSTYSSPRDIQQQQRPYSAIGYNSSNNTRLPSLNEALNGPSYMLDSSPASSMRSFNIPSYTSSNGFPQSPASPNSFDPRKASPSSFSRRKSDAASYGQEFAPYAGFGGDMRSKKPKKLSPGSCQVCGATSTPEWRKSVAGPRTLCNACGLAAAKISNGSAEPTSLNDVLDALRTIGKIRFRVAQFELPPGAQERAAATWNPPADSASSGYSSYSSSGSRSSVSIPGSASSYNSAASYCPPTPSSYASRQSFSTSPQETDAAFTLASLCGSSPPSVNSAHSSLTTPPGIDRGGYFSLGQRPQSSLSMSSPYGASRDLDRQARRLSAMSLDLQASEPPAADPPRASTDSGRMSLASLMNPPDTSSRSRRFSFGSSSSSSSKRPSTFSF